MAENRFQNTRSPRYSTNRASGFAGGSRAPNGNNVPASATARTGTPDSAFAPPPAQSPSSQTSAPSTPAIANFSASVPRPQSTASRVGQYAGSQLVQQGLKKGAGALLDKLAPSKTPGTPATTTPYVDPGIPVGTPLEPPVTTTGIPDIGQPTVTELPPVDGTEPLSGLGTGGGGDIGFAAPEGIASDVAGNVGDIAASSAGDVTGTAVGEAAGTAAGEAAIGEAAGAAAAEAGADAALGATSWVPGWGWIIGAARLAKGVVADSEPGSFGGVVDTLLLPSHEQWIDDPGNSAISSLDPIGQASRDVFGIETPDCFITEAVMSQQGMSDNSEPLMVLRAFRDHVMMQSPEGQAMVAEYEQMAPMVVEAIGTRPDAMQVFQQIYSEFIVPAVEAVKAGEYKGALEIYAKMIAFASSFSEEVMQQDQDALSQIDDFGSHAAMLGQDDDVTAGIAQQGVGDADWSQNDYDYGGGEGPQASRPAIAQMTAPRRF